MWNGFIHEGSPSVVNLKTIYTPIKENGLRLYKVADFWGAVKLSWLQRLPYSKSLWMHLHREEAGNTMFNPMTYNFDMLCAAKKKIKKPIWTEIYENLRKFRLNIVRVYPAEYLTLPVHGEPDITGNFSSIKQDWCKNLQIHQILEKDGNIKKVQSMMEGKKPLSMELNALRIATKDKLDRLRVRAFWIEGELNVRELKPAPGKFNKWENDF